MRYFKIVIINFLVFIFILLLFECLSFLYFNFYFKQDVPFLFSKNNNLVNDCSKVKSHPILSYIHDYSSCEILGGNAQGTFVVYDNYESNKNAILTLGGSTTDGFFYQETPDHTTWPFVLNDLVKKNDLTVINGGTIGYNSTQELLKYLIEARRINNPIKKVISLSGINDLYSYDCCYDFNEDIRSKKFPFYTTSQIRMYLNELWLDQGPTKNLIIFPSILKLITYLTPNNKFKKHNEFLIDSNLHKNYLFKQVNFFDRWVSNHKIMYSISKIMNFEYYVFLQPTMGIKGNQSIFHDNFPNSDNEKSDLAFLKKVLKNEYLDFWGQNYYDVLNDFYTLAKKECSSMSFCYDISDIAPPSNPPNYAEPRHHNGNGNKLIAQEIYDIIF